MKVITVTVKARLNIQYEGRCINFFSKYGRGCELLVILSYMSVGVFTVVVLGLPVIVLVVSAPGLQLWGLTVVPVPPLLPRPQPAVRRRDGPDRILNFANFSFCNVVAAAPAVPGSDSVLGSAGDRAGL